MAKRLMLLLCFAGVSCSPSSNFATGTPAKPVKTEVPSVVPPPAAAPQIAQTPALPKDYTIEFAQKPETKANSDLSVFKVTGKEPIASLVYKYDDAAELETPGTDLKLFSYYGDHKISLKAKFVDGNISSNLLTHQWNVASGGFLPKGHARQIAGSEYLLTNALTGQMGMVISENKLQFRWVEISFSIQFSNIKPGYPADGIAFGLTEKSRDEITPVAGGGLGFLGTAGYGVEFDVYNNNEPATPHVALVQDGSASHVTDPFFFPSLTDSGKWTPVKVCVESGGLFTVIVDGLKVIDKRTMPRFPTDRNFNGHIFISGATGTDWAEQRVRMEKVTYNIVGQPVSCN